ncbi:YsnF/AvaK domain-containing protein [Rhodocytophaga rosea]|uniref:YsnF/AvaK domain-containing protein n=1 Tax=Rhodocytophaga rosea TaxID=2704465 RepID=A0A6C0GKQ3_9BACT|nr:YsnF/AvaK domain-containing protein [Rhodocytophaga rosea]QHT68527.1 YsnF/AvaK domain-containing protein [Rhodocytophaga rosea]
MAQTVIGIFDNESEARRAVDNLVERGFTRNSIDIADRSSSNYTSSDSDYTSRKHDDDDSIGGFFRSLFGSSDESDKYSRVASRGCVVTVHAQSSDEAERAADILDEYGAVNVDERASQFGNYSNTTSSSNFTDTTTTGAAYTADRFDKDTNRFDADKFRDRDVVDTDRVDIDNRTNLDRRDVVDSETSLPIIEEQLNVGKRVVETGGVRLRSRIIEKPVEENLRLREEHVRVERHPVNRPASEADLAGFREGTVEMTERSEVPVVNKEARVIEEISLNKDVEEREETVRDTVRRTDVEVENLKRTDDRIADTDRIYNSDERRLDSDDRTLDDDEELSRPRGV